MPLHPPQAFFAYWNAPSGNTTTGATLATTSQWEGYGGDVANWTIRYGSSTFSIQEDGAGLLYIRNNNGKTVRVQTIITISARATSGILGANGEAIVAVGSSLVGTTTTVKDSNASFQFPGVVNEFVSCAVQSMCEVPAYSGTPSTEGLFPLLRRLTGTTGDCEIRYVQISLQPL